uniref:Transmembrane protein 231 n=1 Tax=Brugia malayi TaxID=6279 RepID=A0A1I9G432_BRUMA|nr:Bm6021, isoform d [Brugia malayi]
MGFWKKFSEYREQAAVYYKQRFIILLKGKAPNNYYVWSSYPLLNHAEETHIRIAVIEEYESDFNDDGKPDLMETAVLDDLDHATESSSLTVSGDLWLDQAAPLWSSGRDPDHGGALINESSLDLAQYNPTTILLRNSFRNFTTTLRR